MKPNEIHEINWSLEQIQNHLRDIYNFMRRDPNYREMFRKKRGFRKKGIQSNRAESPAEERRWNGCPRKGKRRRTPKHKRKANWVERMGSRKKLPKVRIVFPTESAKGEIDKHYAPVPVGNKWVHVGCFVFVPKKVYKHFELVRKALSDRMETLARADTSEEW